MDPITVAVERGGVVESRHRVHAVRVEGDKVREFWGDPELVTFMRSAAKPLQALPLVAAYERLSAEETAIACASHDAAPEQLDAVKLLLARSWSSEDDPPPLRPETDEEAVTFHLETPDADLPFKLALPFAFPVPSDTPAEDQGLEPLPATGPYIVTEAGRERIELERNAAFEEWSAAAQPDGYVDAISWRFNEVLHQAFSRLQAGDLDVMVSEPGPQDLTVLRSTHPDQVLTWPAPFTLFVGFDTLKPPFDDERVRQALNFALDRGHLVDLLGGSANQRQTCQILPPNFQGYEPYCPYTLEPDNLVWSAPDPDRAKALIEEAGAAGTPVDVLVTDQLPPGAVEVMEFVTDVLAEIGLKAKLEIVHGDAPYFTRILPPAGGEPGTFAGTPRHPNLFLSGWASDYLGARNFIEPQFACGRAGFANGHGWCDETLSERMDEASALQLSDPGAANRAWAEIEHQLVDAAVQAPITNPLTTHAVSDRAENVQVHPQWGLMLSLIWVQ